MENTIPKECDVTQVLNEAIEALTAISVASKSMAKKLMDEVLKLKEGKVND